MGRGDAIRLVDILLILIKSRKLIYSKMLWVFLVAFTASATALRVALWPETQSPRVPVPVAKGWLR